MTRRLSAPAASLALAAAALLLGGCPRGDKADGSTDSAAVAAPLDTTPVNFDSLETAIPEAAPDTAPVEPPKARPAATRPAPARYAAAPPALMDAVRREQAFTQFCYQEFGQKADPALQGGVALVVTVSAGGVTDARVAADSWSSSFGKAVNRCLNEKAAEAWRVPAGAVKPGKYQVDLTFRPA
jgi:hypothetical protein